MPDTTNDIDAVLEYLGLIAIPESPRYYAALTALVAERDALKQRVAELEAASKPRYIVGGATIESIDLRERLVCAALTGLCAAQQVPCASLCQSAVATADATLAAMRKGKSDGQ